MTSSLCDRRHLFTCVFQTRRVQPSVPELSLLIDSSFTANHIGPAPRVPAPADRKSAPPMGTASSAPRSPPHPPPHHSTPNSNLQQPCSCCSTHTYTFTSPVLHPGAVPPAFSSHHHTCPPSSLHLSPAPTPSTHPPPPSGPLASPSSPPSVLHPTPPGPFSLPLPVPRCGGSHDPAPPPWFPQCCDQMGGVLSTDAYQLLLQQDRQLRLLQAQVHTSG